MMRPVFVGYSNITPKAKFYAEIMVILFTLGQFIYINFIGRLMLAELIAIAGLLIVNKTRILRASPYLKKILLGYSVFLLGLVISDLYNGSSPNDYLRGWASIVFGVITTLFLVDQFLKSPRAIYIYLVVSVITAIFFTKGSIGLEGVEENSNYFKIKFVPILLPLLALFSTALWSYGRILAIGLLFFFAGIFVVFDARSSGLGLFMASLLLFIQMYKLKPKFLHISLIGLFLILAGYVGYIYYVDQVINHGMGGSNSQQLLKLENPYNPFSLLLEGRSSIVVAAKAIGDQPLLGFGSWGKDPTGEYGYFYGSLHGKDDFVHALGIIPVHSMILAAWVWAGILGFYGMGKIGMAMLGLFESSFWGKSPLAPMLNIYFIAAFWAFLFSPLGTIRTTFPFVIALLIVGTHYSIQPFNHRHR